MRRPVGFFLLAGFAAMLAALVVYGTLQQREAEVRRAMVQSVEIVVAAQDLPLGAKLEASSVKLVRWSRDSLPAGAYQKPDAVIGSFVKNAFVANEPIVASKLFIGEKSAGVMPLLIPAGMRAMSVPVDEVSDIAGFVLPHSRVDVLVSVSAGGADSKPFSKAVLQNVEVLAVAQEVEGTKDTPQVVKVVTLLVSLEDAERLALASQQGTLRLAMRSYNDDKILLTRGVDVSDMLRAYSSREPAPTITAQAGIHRPAQLKHPLDKVEILRNGKSSESLSFIDLSMNLPGDSPKHTPAHARHASRASARRVASAAAPRPKFRPVSDEHETETGSVGPGAVAGAAPSTSAPPPAAADATTSAPPSSGLMPHSRTIDIP